MAEQKMLRFSLKQRLRERLNQWEIETTDGLDMSRGTVAMLVEER